MNEKLNRQLLEAKEHYYALRLVEAYNIWRRYFDRIPFQIDREHAEYIGMFVRVLTELGKAHELKFYVPELERHYEKTKDPAIGFALGIVYRNLPDPRAESARRVFEEVIRHPEAGPYVAKAKMLLAHYYDWKSGDTAACRQLIDSIPEPEDPSIRLLWRIWQAKILRDEKRFDEAQAVLEEVLGTATLETDWYAHYSAKVVLAILFIKRDDLQSASRVVAEVRRLFEGRNFKSLRIQMEELEKQLREKSTLGVVQFVSRPEGSVFIYQNRELKLKHESPAEKLLTLMIKRKILNKEGIVRQLYDRDYNGVEDDRLIYYHVHALRKRLQTIGIPGEAIVTEDEGYRFVPKVESREVTS
jgi:DNA-binding winged helix-turn-helix (wHTH) protein